jgi:hypothetical protein
MAKKSPSIKPAQPANDIKVDADGNKIVEPAYWGVGGSVGGAPGVKK